MSGSEASEAAKVASDPQRRDWPESNCYVDLWIELLLHLELDPIPVLGFTIANDFDFDQWTFYKPRHGEIERLYGVTVDELAIWRDLASHLGVHVDAGRIPLVEVDAHFLPDTAGRDYREIHTKTTIGVLALVPEQERIEYLHNRGRYSASGDDYRGLMRIEPAPAPGDLPPYCEVAKLEGIRRRSSAELREIARDLLKVHRARVPHENPVRRHAAVVDRDLEALFGGEDEAFDGYAFAGIRQCGSGFAFAADHLRWLGEGAAPYEEAADAFATISSVASMLVLKMARIAHSGRLRDLSAAFDEMANAWERGLSALDGALGR